MFLKWRSTRKTIQRDPPQTHILGSKKKKGRCHEKRFRNFHAPKSFRRRADNNSVHTPKVLNIFSPESPERAEGARDWRFSGIFIIFFRNRHKLPSSLSPPRTSIKFRIRIWKKRSTPLRRRRNKLRQFFFRVRISS